MTVHTPNRCANSVMAAASTAGARVVLLDTGNYPSFSNFLNDTWTFTGTDWTSLSTTLVDAGGPLPGRVDAVMSFDGTSTVLYGGRGASSTDGVFQDTWLWNGTAWSKKTPATVPFGRYKAEAAYLAGTGTVMFGGRTINDILMETWVWNDITWTLQSPATSPPARVDHCMASGGGTVLLFGGSGTNSQFNDTWTYNGTTWTKASPATSPSIRSNASMAYATNASIYVMFGGQNVQNYLSETWTYNGTTWTKVVTPGPAGRVGAQMAYDVTSSKVILFGGINGTNGDASNETWAFDPILLTWQLL